MALVGKINTNKYSTYVGNIKAEENQKSSSSGNGDIKGPIKKPSFTATTAQAQSSIRTKLNTNEEKQKYSEISSKLSRKDKKNLDLLLKTGKLLNKKSNDNSTTLDNLYKIITQPRAKGLTAANVLKETINTIANPSIITQQFGDIPKQYINGVIAQGRKNIQTETSLIKLREASEQTRNEINENTINVEHSGACVAASIEFNLAKQSPAEFSRFAESLTSPKISVEKVIQTENLASNALDAIWLFNAFETPYKMEDFKTAKLTLAPDKNAIIRAEIQNSHKDELERSMIDALMQSTFMNVGSQQSYNSLTDIRKGKFNQNDKGLIEFEKTYTESIVEDKNKISMTYQIIDDEAKLIGYETDFNTIKRHILDSLAIEENVIIGYTQVDNNNVIINGHEITIVDKRFDKDDKVIFICVDTDDNKKKDIEYSEDYLLPKIHHAGLPASVVKNDIKIVDNWVEGLERYQKAKNNLNGKPTSL